MKKWKLIAIISSVLIVVALATTLIIIFTRNNNKPDNGSTYKYPSVEPSLSNPNDVFIQLGSRGVTNLEIYNTGILSYGLNVLNDLIDTKLFSDLNISDEELLTTKEVSMRLIMKSKKMKLTSQTKNKNKPSKNK